MNSNKIKVVSRGYTITVVSWENDGDYYNTKSVTVDTIEKVHALVGLVKMCVSKNRQPYGLGNTSEFSTKQIAQIIDFLKEHPALLENNEIFDAMSEDDFMNLFEHWKYELLGSSEYYACRVMSSYTVTASPEDIFVEKIEI